MKFLTQQFGIWCLIRWNSLVMRKKMSLSTLSFTFLTLQSVCDFFKTNNTMRSFFVRKHRKIASEFFCCQHNNSRPKFNAQFNKINQTEEKEKLLLNASLFLVRYVYTISLFPKQIDNKYFTKSLHILSKNFASFSLSHKYVLR